MSLKDELIEAGMLALANTDPPMEPPEYGIDELAEACLHAFLGVLDTKAVEWTYPLDWSEVKKVIAIIREGDE